MKRFLALATLALLISVSSAYAQNSSNSICFTTNGTNCVPVSPTNPFPVTGGGSGGSDVNLIEILGAAPSATNPLWVSPATGATFPVTSSASATGGASQFHLVPAATNNATTVKASAGTVYSAQLASIGSQPVYLKFYDKASAPSCGSDTVVKSLMIPVNSTAANGAGSNVSIPVGASFSTGISICVVAGLADTDNSSVSATSYIINLEYK